MPDVFTAKKKSGKAVAEGVKISSTDSVAHLKRQKMRFLSHYAERPDGLRFQNQEEKEEILVFLRRHFITNVPWIFMTIIFALVPFLILPFIQSFGFLQIDIPAATILVFIIFYYLIVIGYVLLNFISWFYNISIVTTFEVVDIDYSNVTYKDIATTNLREIQDVDYIQKGFFSTIFDYGDVFIQTAGANPNIEFLRIPHPAKVNDIIMDQKRIVVGHE